MAERVAVFIGGSNLYHGLRAHFGRADLDFQRFIAWLVGERKLLRTYHYNAALPVRAGQEAAKNQQRFIEGLRHIPYFEARLGRLEPRGDTYVEKGVDIAIAVAMLSMATRDAYDTCILVSSDGDFVKAVRAVCDVGKHVEVACFRRAYHLRQAADRAIELTEQALQRLWRDT
jgi:uncharacterized LabA/DUF88 family protein